MQPHFALIIEDDIELSDIFSAMLSGIGIQPEILRDGRKALERLEVVAPDLILLDLNLPNVSGIEILAAVRQNPLLAAALVVVITANPHAMRYAEIDADLVLVKPFSFQQGAELIMRLLKKRQAISSVATSPLKPVDDHRHESNNATKL